MLAGRVALLALHRVTSHRLTFAGARRWQTVRHGHHQDMRSRHRLPEYDEQVGKLRYSSLQCPVKVLVPAVLLDLLPHVAEYPEGAYLIPVLRFMVTG